MVKAIMTITEAKTAAIQDWGVESVRLYPFINEDIPDAITKNARLLLQEHPQTVSFSP